jgi:hypothetical protein
VAVLPKVPLLPALPSSMALADLDHLSAAIVAEPAKLDFAPNPNHYCAQGDSRVTKSPARKAAQKKTPDMSPRLRLELQVDCESGQEQDESV